MAPRFATLMYQIYPSEQGADALVCFPLTHSGSILPFRDKLAEAILRMGEIRVNRAQGYPLPPDSTFRFYSERHAESIEAFLQRKRPGFFARLINPLEWAAFRKEEMLIRGMIDAEIETSHDFPCIIVHSRLHSEESMSAVIQQAARGLRLHVMRNKHLESIHNVVTSNRRFEL